MPDNRYITRLRVVVACGFHRASVPGFADALRLDEILKAYDSAAQRVTPAKVEEVLAMFQTSYHEHAGPQYDVRRMAEVIAGHQSYIEREVPEDPGDYLPITKPESTV